MTNKSDAEPMMWEMVQIVQNDKFAPMAVGELCARFLRSIPENPMDFQVCFGTHATYRKYEQMVNELRMAERNCICLHNENHALQAERDALQRRVGVLEAGIQAALIESETYCRGAVISAMLNEALQLTEGSGDGR